ncbi:VanZ family protein [Cellulomonas chengniuliangii]|uniref:VanZ family protein n=1 Tax=Cellulomonas chengniuliangii TaxID=2968084 RepID=UPI001D0EAE4A|nr:VanZ family protein [Cellulomonas chengniuliangii]MCC2317871.1 VanZ family protein [Cellulomonas chengniuliangii]
MSGPRRQALLIAALAGYLALVARMTLRPEPAEPETFDVVREVIAWLADRGAPVTYDGVEAVSNVLMFVPFGVLVGLLLDGTRQRAAIVVGAACATSTAIELAQRAFLPSRVPTVQDVGLNTAGAAVGLGLLLAAQLWLARRRREPGPSPEGAGPAHEQGEVRRRARP